MLRDDIFKGLPLSCSLLFPFNSRLDEETLAKFDRVSTLGENGEVVDRRHTAAETSRAHDDNDDDDHSERVESPSKGKGEKATKTSRKRALRRHRIEPEEEEEPLTSLCDDDVHTTMPNVDDSEEYVTHDVS